MTIIVTGGAGFIGSNFIDLHQLLFADPAIEIRNFFQTADFTVLMLFYRLHEVRRIHQAFVRARVQPSESLT